MLNLEGLSLRYALHEVKQYRLQPRMIKSDNQTIVGKINGKRASDVYTTQIVQDIKKLDGFDGMCRMPIHFPSSKSRGSLYHIRSGL